jgi:hypothetical protein
MRAAYPTVVAQLFQAAVGRGLSSRTHVAAVGDGGNGLRDELAAQFPHLTYVLDRCHVVSHHAEAADACGLKGDAKQRWIDDKLARIDRGDVASVLADLARHTGRGKARVSQLREFLNRYRDALNYPEARARGWPIGSGEVESAHRILPQKRMKLPGAWWREDNLNPMLALRAARLNGQWGALWSDQARLTALVRSAALP